MRDDSYRNKYAEIGFGIGVVATPIVLLVGLAMHINPLIAIFLYPALTYCFVCPLTGCLFGTYLDYRYPNNTPPLELTYHHLMTKPCLNCMKTLKRL